MPTPVVARRYRGFQTSTQGQNTTDPWANWPCCVINPGRSDDINVVNQDFVLPSFASIFRLAHLSIAV